MSRLEVQVEGYTSGQLLALSESEWRGLILTGTPLVFRTGSATLLAAFQREATRLRVVLSHIDGGGEGVLQTLWMLAEQYARKNSVGEIEWLVHAVNCASPNLKLQRLLEAHGFAVERIGGYGEVYRLLLPIPA